MSRNLFLEDRLKLNANTNRVTLCDQFNNLMKFSEKYMSQEISPENARQESAKNAILKRLSYKNLTLDDLLAAKAFAEITNCEPRVIDDINSALGRL